MAAALVVALLWPGGAFTVPGADPVAERMLLRQTASGGWPKNIDYRRDPGSDEMAALRSPRRVDDATIDNDATTSEIAYLAGAWRRTGQAPYLDAARRGVEYLLQAQYPNGGWPQFHPDRSGYRRHVTLNDDAMVQVVALLQDVAEGRGDFVELQRGYGAQAAAAVRRGLDCLLDAQVRIDGIPTIWAQQYDVDTLQPIAARSYELPALAVSESVGVLRVLMRQSKPSPRMKAAIIAAVDWLEAHRLPDLALQQIDDPSQDSSRDVLLVAAPGASLWARFYDLQTQRPLFADRDGQQRDNLAEVSNERRIGYSWYGTWPSRLLQQEFPRWRARHGGDIQP